MSNPLTLSLETAQEHRLKTVRVAIRIPKIYHHEPVISRLASRYHLDVNILAATLGASAVGDGWFSLQLEGKEEEIDSALIYLSDLNIELIYKSGQEVDGW